MLTLALPPMRISPGWWALYMITLVLCAFVGGSIIDGAITQRRMRREEPGSVSVTGTDAGLVPSEVPFLVWASGGASRASGWHPKREGERMTTAEQREIGPTTGVKTSHWAIASMGGGRAAVLGRSALGPLLSRDNTLPG